MTDIGIQEEMYHPSFKKKKKKGLFLTDLLTI